MAALLPYLQAGEPYYVPLFSGVGAVVFGALLGWHAAGPIAAAWRGR